jgi:Sodium/hydrogen exchanger family
VLDPATQPLLFSLVFGEGIINDATSVVLLRAVTNLCKGACPAMSASTAGLILFNFLYLFLFSLVLGTLTGLGIAFTLKRFKCKGPHQVRMGVGCFLAATLRMGVGCYCYPTRYAWASAASWQLPYAWASAATVTTMYAWASAASWQLPVTPTGWLGGLLQLLDTPPRGSGVSVI